MWILWILGLLVVIFIFVCIKNKITIRFGTLFRKGFHKLDDKYGIFCFVGKQGDGKSYSCCDMISEVRGDLKVITNQKVYAERNKDFCIYEPDFYKIIAKFNKGIYDCNYIIYYDELFTLLEKGKLRKEILEFISQLRKRGIYLFTTVQEWLDINVTFRRYVRYYVDCSMFNLPVFNCAISINQIHDGYQMQWNNMINEYESPIIRTTIKKCGLAIAESYDTFEVIADNA